MTSPRNSFRSTKRPRSSNKKTSKSFATSRNNNMTNTEVARATFKAAYRAKKDTINAAEAASKPRGASRKQGVGSSGSMIAPSGVLPEKLADLQQKDFKQFLPPGAFLWKSNYSNSWSARLPPFSAISRSWLKYGSESACKQVVSEVWARWCIVEGISQEDCPMKGPLWAAEQ